MPVVDRVGVFKHVSNVREVERVASRTIYVCDCCKKEAPAFVETNGDVFTGSDLPDGWFAANVMPRADRNPSTSKPIQYPKSVVCCDTCEVQIKPRALAMVR